MRRRVLVILIRTSRQVALCSHKASGGIPGCQKWVSGLWLFGLLLGTALSCKKGLHECWRGDREGVRADRSASPPSPNTGAPLEPSSAACGLRAAAGCAHTHRTFKSATVSSYGPAGTQCVPVLCNVTLSVGERAQEPDLRGWTPFLTLGSFLPLFPSASLQSTRACKSSDVTGRWP